MPDLQYKNSAGEQYRCEYDGDLKLWYAKSIDIPWHITRGYQSLSEALLAADLAMWLPLRNLTEARR